MNIGFTGTRRGLTFPQRAALCSHLDDLDRFQIDAGVVAHHGGCVGGDREFHEFVRDTWGLGARIVIHPMSNAQSSLCDWTDADELLPARPNRERNEAIVRGAFGGVLIACPASGEHDPDSQRSGTWQTIRIGRKADCRAVIIYPDGRIEGDRG